MGILSWKFRIVLFLGSVVVFLLIARFVRKQRIQVKDGIFWILFSVILIIFSIFPRLAIWASYFNRSTVTGKLCFYAYYFYIRMSPVLFIN